EISNSYGGGKIPLDYDADDNGRAAGGDIPLFDANSPDSPDVITLEFDEDEGGDGARASEVHLEAAGMIPLPPEGESEGGAEFEDRFEDEYEAFERDDGETPIQFDDEYEPDEAQDDRIPLDFDDAQDERKISRRRNRASRNASRGGLKTVMGLNKPLKAKKGESSSTVKSVVDSLFSKRKDEEDPFYLSDDEYRQLDDDFYAVVSQDPRQPSGEEYLSRKERRRRMRERED
ncbi:MAG: hypothetical protein Q4D04_13420, partial [Clostridia bacterium]|nr:hypothetical protein [Clostridia bacterium]